MKNHRWIVILLITANMALGVSAQTWPDKPIRLVVSFPPGGPGDIVARLIQPGLQKELGRAVIVENRPGGGGNLGAQEVVRAADQHTFLVGPDTMMTVNPHVYKKMAFKPGEDLLPVTLLAGFSQMLVCHPSAQVKTVGELVAKAKATNLNYASGGAGVPGHLAMELLLSSAGVEMTYVGYKGPAPAAQDVMAGHVPCGFLAGPLVGPQAKNGKLVALAVSGNKRSLVFADVPTVEESGIKGFDATFFQVLAAPRNTPPAVVQRLHQAVVKTLQQPEIRQRLHANDMDPVGNLPAEAGQRLAADRQKWGVVVKKIGLELE